MRPHTTHHESCGCAEAEAERWRSAFSKLVESMHGDFDCEPGCDSYGHEANCANTDPTAAFARLRMERDEARAQLTEAVEVLRAIVDKNDALIASCGSAKVRVRTDPVIQAAADFLKSLKDGGR